MTLNFIGTNPLSRCVSDNASSIHLFIYPAIITNYHFFYRAFISKSYRRAYNFTSVLYDPTKPVLRKVLVNFSQVDFNRKFYKVFKIVGFELFSLARWRVFDSSLVVEDPLFLISKSDFWLIAVVILYFLSFHSPKLLKWSFLKIPCYAKVTKQRIYDTLSSYPNFRWASSEKSITDIPLLSSQISNGSIAWNLIKLINFYKVSWGLDGNYLG